MRLSNEFQAILLDNISEAIVALNKEHRIIYFNQAAEKIFGFHAQEVIDQPIDLLLPERFVRIHRQHIREFSTTPATTRMMEKRPGLVARRKDGAEFPVEIGISKVASGLEEFYAAIVVDITERKRAEEEIRQQAARQGALNEIIGAVTEAGADVGLVMETALDLTLKVFGLDLGTIWLKTTPDREVGIILRGIGMEIATAMVDSANQRLVDLLVPKVVADWNRVTAPYAGMIRSHGIGASVTVPLLAGTQPIGGLALAFSQPRVWSDEQVALVETIGRRVGMAVERAHLLRETQERAAQLELLYDAGLSLNQILDFPALVETLLKTMNKMVHADRADFFRLNPARQVLTLESGAGYNEDSDVASIRKLEFAIGEERGLVGQVASERAPLYLADVHNDPRWIPFNASIHSVLWVPVERQGELRGVLVVNSKRIDAFTRADQRLVALFANQLSVAIENARLYSEARHRLSELEAVNKMSIVLRAAQTLDEMLPILMKETLAALDAAAVSIWLHDPTTNELKQVAESGFPHLTAALKPTQGIAGRVFTTGELYVSQEFRSDPLTVDSQRTQVPAGFGGACAPIRTTDQVIGALFVSVQQPRQMTPQEIALLNVLAELAGTAIHRTRLHEEAEEQIQHLAALHTIDKAITSSFDQHVTFEVILDHALTQLHVDAADILLLNSFSQMLEYSAGRGFRSNWSINASVRLGEPHAGRAALGRSAVYVSSDVAAGCSREFSALVRSEGFVSYYGIPLIAKGEVKGVLELFQRSPLVAAPRWIDFVETLAEQTAIAVDNAALFANLQRSNTELTLAYDTTLEGWSRTLDLRDKETEGHTQRVTEMTLRLARAMKVSDDELIQMRRGALLHDIGKMGVPDRILLKPGALSDEEWQVMHKHPSYAYELLSPIVYLHGALDIPYCHHEKWDGTGYPRGLQGEQIPLAARIFAVVDIWDALCSDRPYRAAWPEEKVREHIQSLAGAHLDANVVQVFLKLVQTTDS